MPSFAYQAGRPLDTRPLDTIGGAWKESEATEYHWSRNNLSFQGHNFNEQAKGEAFIAGTIGYTTPASVMFSLESSSFDSDFSWQLPIEIAIDSSPNQDSEGNPLSLELAADYIYFSMFPEFGSLRVFEGEEGTVEILAEFNSLHFKGFGEVLTPDTAFLISTSLTTIPVPATVWFFGTGLVGLAGMARNKSRT